jgi:hypothetical protein
MTTLYHREVTQLCNEHHEIIKIKFYTNFFFSPIFLGGILFRTIFNTASSAICRPSHSTVPTDAGIEPGPSQLVHWQSDALTTRLDLIRKKKIADDPKLACGHGLSFYRQTLYYVL